MSNYELSTKKALERIFVYQAVEYGFLTQEQLKECIEEQERQSTDENQIDLLTICKQKKYLTASQCNHLMSKRLDASVARALGESLNQKEEKKPSIESQVQEIVQETTQQFKAIAREEREELERRMNEKERVLDRERKQAEFYRRKQEALEKKLESFEEDKQNALQEKQNQIEKLENELNNLQRMLMEQNQNFSQYRNVLQEKDSSLERERQKNQALFKLLEGTNKEIQEATEEKMKWEAEYERISKELDFKLTQESQEKNSLKQNIEAMESKLQEAENKAKETENKYHDAEQKVQEVESKLQEAENKAKETENKVQEAENKVQETENKVQELNIQLKNSEDKLQEFTARHEELSNELEKIRTINQNLEQKVADYTIQHANQQELEKRNLAQTQSFEAFKREKEDFLKQVLQEKQKLERDIVSITSEKQKLEQNIQDINTEKQKLEQNIQNISTEKQKLEQNIQHINTEKQKLEQNIQNINTEKQKLEQNIQHINTEKQELEQNIQHITAEKKQQEQLFEQQKTAQEATFHSEKIALESELSQYKQKNENLEAKLQKFQESLGNWDEVERQKNQYKQILEQEQKKQKLLLKEKAELEERLSEAENKMHHFSQIPVDGSNLEPGTLLPGSNGESYVIQGMIGRGGMGIAYSALRQSDENIVVVKTLLPEHMGDMKVIIRFVQEARTILGFDHENLVHGYDIYQGSTLSFFVMEYLDGPSVEEILEEQPMIEPLRATEIVLGIARALEYLEKHSLVHRDVKPANIIITQNGTPKLVDFGIVKMTDRNCSLTTDGIILGTPYYLSPEQTYQTNVDIRSDIYSLGATFFHMVVGEVPFPGDNPIDVIQKRLTKTPKPEKIKSDLPKPICAVIERMMNRNVKKRYDTVTDLVHELEGIIKILKR